MLRSSRKYWLQIDIGSVCDVISWHVLLSIFTGAEFWAGYVNPKTGLSRAFASLHFGSMHWCYIFNCVYYVPGIYGLKLWLDPYDYEHLHWPWLLFYYMWCDIPDCTFITVNYLTHLIGLTCFEFLPLWPCTFTHELSVFFGIHSQLVSEVWSLDFRHHNHGKRCLGAFGGCWLPHSAHHGRQHSFLTCQVQQASWEWRWYCWPGASCY